MVNRGARESAVGDEPLPLLRQVGAQVSHHAVDMLIGGMRDRQVMPDDAANLLEPVDLSAGDDCQSVGLEAPACETEAKIPEGRQHEAARSLEAAVVEPEKEDGQEYEP